MSRASVLIPIALLLVPLTSAKDKSKSLLPADVLRAQTVLVIINPDAGEPVTDPSANRRAREDVEKSIMKWGRFRLALDPQTADLVVAVRKGTGQIAGPTIHGSPLDVPPVIVEPNGSGDTRIGAQHGQPPGVSQRGTGMPQDTEPRVGTDIGPSEDTLEVYRGGVDYPLDSAPVWRYSGKDALRPPAVSAVDQFRKAIDDSEKAATQKQSKPKP
jgi:hypothetical protein